MIKTTGRLVHIGEIYKNTDGDEDDEDDGSAE